MPVKLTAKQGRKLGLVKAGGWKPTKGGLTFPSLCIINGIPKPEPEYRFAPPRRWRFDWAWPGHFLALEIDGGVWVHGRHTRGAGFIRDQEKGNEAALLGWWVLHCTPADVKSGAVFALLRRAF